MVLYFARPRNNERGHMLPTTLALCSGLIILGMLVIVGLRAAGLR